MSLATSKQDILAKRKQLWENAESIKKRATMRRRMMSAIEVEESNNGTTKKIVYTAEDVLMKRNLDQFIAQFCNDSGVISDIKKKIISLHTGKLYLVLYMLYEDTENETEEVIRCKTGIIEFNEHESELAYKDKLKDATKSFRNELLASKSGLIFKQVDKMEVYIVQTQLLSGGGGSYIELPYHIKSKQACLNITNKNDNKCFLWCILAALHPIEQGKHPDRVSSYSKYENEVDMTMFTSYPIAPNDHVALKLFEKINNIPINIFYLEKEVNERITPVYRTSISKFNCAINVVNLLYIQLDSEKEQIGFTSKSHYVLIKEMSKLFSNLYKRRLPTRNHNKIYICDYCLSFTTSEVQHSNHIQHDCQKNAKPFRIFPRKGKEECEMKFKNVKRQQLLPFTLYYDTETYFEQCERDKDKDIYLSKTETSKQFQHKLYSYGILVDSKIPNVPNKYICNCKLSPDQDIEQEFVDDLMILYEECLNIIEDYVKNPIPFNEKPSSRIIHNAKIRCDYCGVKFNTPGIEYDTKKTLHHNHFDGSYVASLCNKCNLAIDLDHIPVCAIAHNSVKYDQHLIMRKLTKYARDNERDIFIIPNNDEGYKEVKIGNFHFIDSLNFLSGNLRNLTMDLQKTALKNHNKHDLFKYIYEEFRSISEDVIDKYLLQKNFFPYEYMDDLNKFTEKIEDLPIEAFNSKLTNSTISEADYQFVKEVQSIFKFDCIRSYNLFYLKVDVCILASVFNDFRNIIFEHFQLDPCWYISLPSLTLDAYLKTSNKPIELLSDEDMYDFFVDALYGGLSYINLRKANANNEYCVDYDDTKPTSYLLYLDYNSLYPSVMSACKLPIGNYEWISDEDKEKVYKKILSMKPYSEQDLNETTKGYYLEVDCHYPMENREYYLDYPILPERKEITLDQLSDIQIKRGLMLGLIDKGKYYGTKKLINDLTPKYRYKMHYQHFLFAIKHGLCIDNVYRILEFDEVAHMSSYVETIKDLRSDAKKNGQTSKSNTMKKMMNSLYGKMCERVENRSSTKIAVTPEDIVKYASQPQFKEYINIGKDTDDDKMTLIHFYNMEFMIDKPLHIGTTILSLSKLQMMTFWYDCIKKNFPKSILCMTDTDSLLFYVETNNNENFYKSIPNYPDLDNWLDGSNLNLPELADIPMKCKSIDPCCLNKLKFEEQDSDNLCIITKFRGLKSKCYLYIKEDTSTYLDKTVQRCKGLITSLAGRLDLDLFDRMIEGESNSKSFEVYHIRSFKHEIFTVKENKIGLTSFDDKRFFLNKYMTVPYGFNDLHPSRYKHSDPNLVNFISNLKLD